MRIENAVDERIGEFILSARNVADIDAFEIAQQLQRSAVQRLKRRVLHAVLPEQLFDHEFGIEPHRQLSHPKAHRGLEPGEETVPLGNVVGCMPEIAKRLLDHRTAIVDQHRRTGRGAGVTASASIGKEGNVTGSPSVHSASISRIVTDFRLEFEEHAPVRSKSSGIMGGRTLDRTLLLHVGTHKTGTTALQAMLVLNRDALAAQGIAIPDTGRVRQSPDYETPGHHALAWELAASPPYPMLARAVGELQSLSARTAVISSEEFSPIHHHHEALSALRSAFAEAGYRTVVLLYLRPQARYAESIFQQHVRDHRYLSFATLLEEILDRGCSERGELRFEFLYSRMLDSLTAAFGGENIVVRPYLPDRGPEHLHRDFLRVVGMLHGSLSMDFTMTIANERFTLRELLQALHRTLRNDEEIDAEKLAAFAYEREPQFDERLLDHRFLLLQYDEAAAFLSRFASDNALVAARSGAHIPFRTTNDLPPPEHPIWSEAEVHRRIFEAAADAWRR